MKIKTNVWWIEKAEQFAIKKDRPFAKAWEPLYTRDQLLEVIEQCAKVCRDKSPAEYATGKVDHNEMAWSDSCAIDIRKLKETLL